MSIKYFDNKTFVVNLMKEDNTREVSVTRLQKMMDFICRELERKNKLNSYRIYFDVSRYSVENMVKYNHDIFTISLDNEFIWLRKNKSAVELADKYKLDELLKSIVVRFCKMDLQQK